MADYGGLGQIMADSTLSGQPVGISFKSRHERAHTMTYWRFVCHMSVKYYSEDIVKKNRVRWGIQLGLGLGLGLELGREDIVRMVRMVHSDHSP